MNKKGFAITGIIYTLMVIFIILIITLLAMFNDRKSLLDELKERVINDMNESDEVLNMTYIPKTTAEANADPYYEYNVKVKGYYILTVTSSDGSYAKGKFYLKEGEKLYVRVGSKTYNNGKTEIFINDKVSTILAAQKYQIYTVQNYEGRSFIDVTNGKGEATNNGKAEITYGDNKRTNKDLNKIRYVKDCLHSNSANTNNEWAEIMVIKDGVNYAGVAEVTGDVDNPLLVKDNNLYSMATSNLGSENKVCVTLDLGQIYDIDYIYVWHNFSDQRIYYERSLSVSADNESYREIDNYEVPETEKGNIVSAYNPAKVKKVGDVYLSVKHADGKTWLRIFHHNNRWGTVLWDAEGQVLNSKGYQKPYKVSGLSFLSDFVRSTGYYELLLEYPELDFSINWTQKNNFTKSSSPGTFLSLSGNTVSFNGLRKSAAVNTTISSTDDKYHIGALNSTSGGIIGPNEIITGTVDLWVRID